jgi:hypothetical protein
MVTYQQSIQAPEAASRNRAACQSDPKPFSSSQSQASRLGLSKLWPRALKAAELNLPNDTYQTSLYVAHML